MTAGPGPVGTGSPRVVAVAASVGQARSLVPLLALVGEGSRVVSWHRSGSVPVDAVVASDPDVLATLDLDARRRGGTSIPVACRVRSKEDFDAARRAGAAVTFTDVVELAAPGGPLGEFEPLLVPTPGLDVGRYPVIPPLVRARMRAAHGLSDPLVVAVDRIAPSPSSATSLALASAAVVSDPGLVPLALALGTPSVVEASLAARFGLTPDVEVLVPESGGDAEADRLAAGLARDDARCAALSRRARRHAERHLDLGAVAASIRVVIRLEPEPSPIDLRLTELQTPRSSRLFARAHDALDIFTTEAAR